MLPTRRQLSQRQLPQTTDDRNRETDQLVARGRVDSGIDFHDAGPFDAAVSRRAGFEGDEEPTAGQVERQRAYSDWLAGFEPRQQRTGERKDVVRLGADQVHARSGERAA